MGNGETVLSSFLPLRDPLPASTVRVVEMRRLDDLLPKLTAGILADPRVFLKMDTQGFDDAVVDGAASALTESSVSNQNWP